MKTKRITEREIISNVAICQKLLFVEKFEIEQQLTNFNLARIISNVAISRGIKLLN